MSEKSAIFHESKCIDCISPENPLKTDRRCAKIKRNKQGKLRRISRISAEFERGTVK